ncbi:MAG: diacylglycerol kinase family lipid kinase [Bacilli bacterium]|nr:diacylglycerol kinase family lipid kinase [Bacilli bacterium]
MKYVFIVNPKSGKGKALEISKKVEEVCIKRGIDYEIVYTERPKDATLIAKEFKRDKCVIFSVGGDGTVNEVMRGVIDTKNMLGVIPGGSGNDFYKMLDGSYKLYQECDIGKVNNEYFINTFSIGIDADICDNLIVMRRKNIPTSQIYNASLVYTFLKYKDKPLEIEINGEVIKDNVTLLSVCNGRVYGGGYKIAPNAYIDDGMFDVYLATNVPKVKIPGLVLKVKDGKHESSKYVRHFKTDRIKIKSPSLVIAEIDGEVIEEKEFDIKLLDQKIVIYHNNDFVNECLDKPKHLVKS